MARRSWRGPRVAPDDAPAPAPETAPAWRSTFIAARGPWLDACSAERPIAAWRPPPGVRPRSAPASIRPGRIATPAGGGWPRDAPAEAAR